MAVRNSVTAIPLANIDSSAISSSYAAVSAAFPYPIFLLRIMNASDEDITVSYDGTNDHDYVIKGSTLTINLQNNAQPNTNICKFSAQTLVYVKGTSGTGTIYVAGYAQLQG